MKFLIFVIAILMPLSVYAQGLDVLCKSLPEYQKGANVEFVAGSDDVVPADINPLNAAVPAVIDIPINVQLIERFPDLDIPDDLELEPTVSLISVHQSGRITYNGQDISKQLYTACENHDSVADTISGHMHGQGGEDVLNSDTVMVKEGIEAEVLQPIEAKKTESDVLEGQYPK